jgi:hypothetical protein
VRFELREYEIRGMLGPRPCTSDAPFAMVPIELSRDALVSFRRVISGQENQRGELDFWLRHPDEPDTVGNALWGGWRVREDMGADAQPATASFWEAYRCAAWYGCRLPSLVEWQIASYIPMPILEPGKVAKAFDRRVLPPVAVDSEPAWDNTQRGVCFANSNVREWVLDNRRNDPVGFLAVPLVAGKTGSETFLPVVPNRRDDAPSGVYGIRLCRSLLPLPIR